MLHILRDTILLPGKKALGFKVSSSKEWTGPHPHPSLNFKLVQIPATLMHVHACVYTHAWGLLSAGTIEFGNI